MKRLENIPVPAIATTLSILTLSNVYGDLGFTWFRYLVMACGALFIVCYIIKMAMFSKTCIKEYQQTIPASLYGAFSMCLMILGNFAFTVLKWEAGRILWYIAVVIHICQILVFAVMHVFGKVIKNKEWTMMMPSWYVTFNGLMVACVTGGPLSPPPVLLQAITIYGCIIYLLILPFMIVRLLKVEIKPPTFHTMAVLLAPASLCVVSLCNVFGASAHGFIIFMYVCVVCSLIFIILKLPVFFSYDFYPGYAGLTFPMAIGLVASRRFSAYLAAQEMEDAAAAIMQLSGLQLFLTSMLVGYVVLMFLRMLFKNKKR